tara:strand:+ start:6301 stop:7176 length:876 start_codon:yes stop_codon:yes gene_type:complete
MSTITLTSFNAGEVIVSADMNTNFDNINNWAGTVALKAGAAFTGDVSITTGTFTVGANAAGDDVKFFGDTSGAYMEWDADTDDLILAGAARVVVPDGQLVLGSTAVTSTAAELNILDGVTASTGEINILDGVTATAGELNILDGVTATTAEINYLDDDDLTAADLTKLAAITSSAAEINVLDGVTAGTVSASKAVVVDSNSDVTAFRNITATGDVTAVNAVFSGDITCQDAITFEGSSADDHETTITVTNPTADRTFTIADQDYTLLRNIYVQDDEPSGGTYFTGDLWIDT